MGIEGKKIRSTNVYFAHKLLFGIAKKAAMQTNEEPEQAIVALIFSFNCLEAFINETIDSTELFCGGRRTEKERELYEQMLCLQKSKESTLDKYKKSKRLFTNNHWNRSLSPYKDFEILRNLRNSIIHRPPEVINGEMTIGEGLYKYTSKYERPEDELMELSNLGIIGTIQANESWLDLIMTPKFSDWCCDVAKGIIDNFLSSLHEGRFKDKMIEQMSLQEDG
ncbi:MULTISPECIES: hypothetical protein [Vibrio diabolicus subgroup]|uniref:hypothetical protein n=1 Tax=Vibrio diabolicus subgroup TaxID=2315253 RepID=UPI002286C0D2|nr:MULTISPECIES: hypothetical protein [Vibrio diabolicus subgroup]MCS0048908.1 hypothetical protein [Vibrio antiquarius]MCZ0743188.1 hypothetical protein [Vibrio diabolicus]